MIALSPKDVIELKRSSSGSQKTHCLRMDHIVTYCNPAKNRTTSARESRIDKYYPYSSIVLLSIDQGSAAIGTAASTDGDIISCFLCDEYDVSQLQTTSLVVSLIEEDRMSFDPI